MIVKSIDPEFQDVKMSGNWMWAAKCEGGGAALVLAADALCEALKKAGKGEREREREREREEVREEEREKEREGKREKKRESKFFRLCHRRWQGFSVDGCKGGGGGGQGPRNSCSLRLRSMPGHYESRQSGFQDFKR